MARLHHHVLHVVQRVECNWLAHGVGCLGGQGLVPLWHRQGSQKVTECDSISRGEAAWGPPASAGPDWLQRNDTVYALLVLCAGEEEDSWPKKGMREKLSQRLAASDSRGSTDETGSGHHHHQQHHSQHLDRTGTPPLPPHSSTH